MEKNDIIELKDDLNKINKEALKSYTILIIMYIVFMIIIYVIADKGEDIYDWIKNLRIFKKKDSKDSSNDEFDL